MDIGLGGNIAFIPNYTDIWYNLRALLGEMNMNLKEKLKIEKRKYIKAVGTITLRILLALFVVLIIIMLSQGSIEPLDNKNAVESRFYVRDININGTKLVNYHLSAPFFLYMESSYVPISKALGEIMGFTYLYDEEDTYLLLGKIEPVSDRLPEEKIKNQGDNPLVHVRYDMRVFLTDNVVTIKNSEADKNGEAGVSFEMEGHPATRKVDLADLVKNLDKFDMMGFPVLEDEEGIIYLPLKALASPINFDWDILARPNYGLAISTVKGVAAESLIDPGEEKYYEGLAAYIRSRNQDIRPSVSQEYTFYFLNAARANDLPVERIMAIAQCESRFRSDIESRAGALGMMQIMLKTGEGYGLSKDDLLNPQKNIDFGARYYAQLMEGYKGDEIRALSAYQMGIPKENLGNYEPGYAHTILWAENTLEAFMVRNGYNTT